MIDLSLKILFVTPVSPYGQSGGAQQRSLLLMEALQQLGKVDLLVLQRGSNGTATVAPIAPFGVSVTLARSRRLRRLSCEKGVSVVAENLPQPIIHYDVIVCRYLWPVFQLKLPDRTPLFIDLDDIDYRFDAASLRSPDAWRTLLYKRLGGCVARWYLKRLPSVAGVFFVSELDRNRARLHFSSSILPNVPIRQNSFPERVPDGDTILLVGSMWYRPNKEAANWFIARVWPDVLLQAPNARLLIAGAAPAGQLSSWSQVSGVTALGFVADLDELYARAALAIVPVQSGGGSNIKLLEALAHGCPCVASQFSHQSLTSHLKADEHLLVAKSARAFGEACLHVLRDASLGRRLGHAGEACVTKNFSIEAFTRITVDFIRGHLQSA